MNLGCKELGRHRVSVVRNQDDPPSCNQKRYNGYALRRKVE